MLKRLKVQHFRSLGDICLDFRPITILVGPNGSGKSNVIDVIRFVRDMFEYGLDHAMSDRGGIAIVRQQSPTSPYKISIQMEFERKNDEGVVLQAKYKVQISSRGDEAQIDTEEAEWSQEVFHWNRERDGFNSSGLELLKLRRDSNSTVWVNNKKLHGIAKDQLAITGHTTPPESHAFGINPIVAELKASKFSAIYPNVMRLPSRIDTDRHLKEDCSNWGSVIKAMRRRRTVPSDAAMKNVMNFMSQAMPRLEQVRVQNVGGYMIPQFLMSDPAKGRSFHLDPNQISDGTLRLFGLFLAIFQIPRPSLLALEEPELTVHPGMLGLISEAANEAAESTQILITTHSPYLLDSFNPESINVTDISSGETKISPMKQSQFEAVKKGLMTVSEIMSLDGLRPEHS